MIVRLMALCAVAYIAISCRTLDKVAPPSQVKIAGGEEVKDPNDPLMQSTFAIIKANGNKFDLQCTATLIGPHHIVTAGHCLEDGVKNTFLAYGNLPKPIPSVKFTHFLMHPQKNVLNFDSPADIALILFDGNIDEVPHNAVSLFEGDIHGLESLTLAGYGYVIGKSNEMLHAGVLRWGDVSVESVSASGGLITSRHKTKASCPGDSGGPAYDGYASKSPLTIVGVATTSTCAVYDATPDARPDSYESHHIPVAKFRDWMECSFWKAGSPLPKGFSKFEPSDNTCDGYENMMNDKEFLAFVREKCRRENPGWDFVDDLGCYPATEEACIKFGGIWNKETGKCESSL